MHNTTDRMFVNPLTHVVFNWPHARGTVKTAGVTLDWSTVEATAAEVTLPDGSVIAAGQKYIRYGQLVARIDASGEFGPWDPSATDGRQRMTRGECYLSGHTITQFTRRGLLDVHVGDMVEGGMILKSRILYAADGDAPTVATGPAWSSLLDAFPLLMVASESEACP